MKDEVTMAKKNRHKNPTALKKAARLHIKKRRAKQNGGAISFKVPKWRG